ncbi:hypothetical protein MN116_002080 [Schistosoma mekongi]|uniref:Peptidase S59 domain-containing protein n=1 Tax=Schistosoma mekongi TaxID=38744 RepID=A0AAE1ZJD3_SCHME|nr:hypothetical protein MN116_002080 [Schistosoma mekongi]
MSINQADIDEECLVYPAITKNYSEVKNTDGLSAELNNIPSHNPNSVSRPLRSTLKIRPTFESDKVKHTDKRNSEKNNTLFTVNTREPIIPDTLVHKIHKFGNMEKNGAMKSQLSTLRNDMEICDSDQSTPCGSKEHLKRPSIQQLRKYSVVDPNTLKFIEG